MRKWTIISVAGVLAALNTVSVAFANFAWDRPTGPAT
jgi:hypothetical protein